MPYKWTKLLSWCTKFPQKLSSGWRGLAASGEATAWPYSLPLPTRDKKWHMGSGAQIHEHKLPVVLSSSSFIPISPRPESEPWVLVGFKNKSHWPDWAKALKQPLQSPEVAIFAKWPSIDCWHLCPFHPHPFVHLLSKDGWKGLKRELNNAEGKQGDFHSGVLKNLVMES